MSKSSKRSSDNHVSAWRLIDEGVTFCFADQNDGVEEELRNVAGVPDATYLVEGGKVFVFDKLVHLVNERRNRQSNLPLADLARSLIADATVSATEAVERWSIVPEPYELSESPEGGLMILHRPFNARLPGTFPDKRCAYEALARLLVGGIQPGQGAFVYRGQPMTLCDPVDPALLPPRPAMQCGDAPEQCGYTVLSTVTYKPGFAPISEPLFNDVKEREAAWAIARTRSGYALDHAGHLWARAPTLRLETLDDPADEVPEYCEQEFRPLRSLYPELGMLSDGSLYEWFDLYQMECRFVNGWTAYRCDEFLFYLLGKVAGREYKCDTAIEVGLWAGCALVRGDSMDAALAFARSATEYDTAMSRLARRIADAMRFLSEGTKRTELRWHAITTRTDLFREGRKFATRQES